MPLTITHYGTATALVQYGSFAFLTDPVLDPGPAIYVRGPVELARTIGPRVGIDDVPAVDAVLLSHDEHPDNLDDNGRAFLGGKPVFTTVSAVQRLGGEARGLAPWQSRELSVENRTVRITGTPCSHGPFGEVTGFVLEAPGEDTVYISGDTVYYSELDEVAQRFDIDVAILHLGAAKVPVFAGDELISMNGTQAAELTAQLSPRAVVPVHYESWDHFTESKEDIVRAFGSQGNADVLKWLDPGVPTVI